MIDWKWLGWALVGSAILTALAVYVVRLVTTPSDVVVSWIMAIVFFGTFLVLLIVKLRYDAWWRQYRLTQDYETSLHGLNPKEP